MWLVRALAGSVMLDLIDLYEALGRREEAKELWEQVREILIDGVGRLTKRMGTKQIALTFAQIDAIHDFFEGEIPGDSEITIIESSDEQRVLYLSVGAHFYRCDKLKPTKCLVKRLPANKESDERKRD